MCKKELAHHCGQVYRMGTLRKEVINSCYLINGLQVRCL